MSSTAPAFQPKLIYLAKRNRQLSSREAFRSRWRQHGALGMSMPRWRNIARYVHCDVLPSSEASAGLAQEYDGIGMVWHRSLAARSAHFADTTSRGIMERDEAATFAEPVVNCCVLTREVVLIAPRRKGDSAVKITRFLRGSGPMNSELVPHLQGYVMNEPLPPERDRWGLACDAIEELWFEDTTSAVRAAAMLREPNSETITVLTNEVILHEG